MTTAERLTATHDWLLACTAKGPETVVQMLEDLRIARANGIPWEGVPDDGISLQELLCKLEADGRARREGSYWRWKEGRQKSPGERQASLFG